MPFDLCIPRKQPIRHEIAPLRPICPCEIKQSLPHIRVRLAVSRAAVSRRNVFTDSVPFIAMDSTLALLQIDRVGRQIPVGYGMTVMMKIEALLTHGCCHENERPKGRIECRPYALLSRYSRRTVESGGNFFVIAIIAEPHGKTNMHGLFRHFNFARIARSLNLIDAQGRGTKREVADQFGRNLFRPLERRL